MANETYNCPVCVGTDLVWDADGVASGCGFPCWYCTNCAFVTPPTDEYPAPES